MFEMGFWEITLIFIIMLIVVGPERLPKLARTAGLWIGKARSMVSSVRAEIEQEIRVEELKQSLRKETESIEDMKSLSDDFKSVQSEVTSLGRDVKTKLSEAERAASSEEKQASTPTSRQEKPAEELTSDTRRVE